MAEEKKAQETEAKPEGETEAKPTGKKAKNAGKKPKQKQAATSSASEASSTESSYKPKIGIKKEPIAKAIRAILQVVKKKSANQNELFEANAATMFLKFNLGMVPPKRKLRPWMIQLPHPMHDENSEICFFSTEPQKAQKELVLNKLKVPGVTKVIGIHKLNKNYKPLEAKKALCEAFDLFLCDARVLEMMPGLLGNIFYKERRKLPIPIKMGGTAKEYFKRAIEGTPLRIPSGPCMVIKIGRCSMSEEQLVANCHAVIVGAVKHLAEVHNNYVNVIHVQATDSIALPIWKREASGDPVNLKKWKSDAWSSTASDTGASGISETEVHMTEMASDAGETLSTKETSSEIGTQDETTQSELDTEAGDVDSETVDKEELPLLKGLKKRSKRRDADDGTAAAAVKKRAAKEAAPEPEAEDMPPPEKKAKKAKKGA